MADTCVERPYTVHGAKHVSRHITFISALADYRTHDGYVLRNESEAIDDGEFSGLTDEERAMVGE